MPTHRGSPATLEAVLKPLFPHIVILRHRADRARLHQAVKTEVGLEPHPVVWIPVETECELVGMEVEGGDILWRKNVVEKDARLLPLDPGVTERHFPGPPSLTAAAGAFGPQECVLDTGRAVFRPLFPGDQVSSGGVPCLESDRRKIAKSKSTQSQSADCGPVEKRLDVFVAEAPTTFQIGELTLVPPHIAVGPELREKGVSEVRLRRTGREFAGKSTRLTVSDRPAEGQSLQPAIFLAPPGVQADSPPALRDARVFVVAKASSVERAGPILEGATLNVAVNHDTWAAKD